MTKSRLAAATIALFLVVGGVSFAASGAGSASVTQQRVLILLLTYSDTNPTNLTPAEAALSFNTDTAVYYEQQSYNQLAIDAQAAGWYQIPYLSSGSCNTDGWANAGKAAAAADGVDVSSFTHFLYVMSGGIPSCGSAIALAGVGQVWGGPNIVSGCTSRHEFGHAERLNHTEGLGPIGGNCLDRIPAAQLDQVGWLSAVSATTGSYSLVSVEQQSGLRSIQIPRGDGTRFVLEYRANPFTDSLYVEKDSGYIGGFGSFVNWVTADPCGDKLLQASHSYYDSDVRILITYGGLGHLSIALNADPPPLPGPDITAPSSPSNITTVRQGQKIVLSWNSSVDDRCGVITYRVYRNGALLGATTDTSYVDTPPKKTTVVYSVTATDQAGNTSGSSQ